MIDEIRSRLGVHSDSTDAEAIQEAVSVLLLHIACLLADWLACVPILCLDPGHPYLLVDLVGLLGLVGVVDLVGPAVLGLLNSLVRLADPDFQADPDFLVDPEMPRIE